MSIFDKECPRDPHDAYREGERSRYYERNPYEHGRHGDDYGCRRAYEEWDRGKDHAERERRDQEEAMEREAQRRDMERQHYAREEERMLAEAMEAEQARYAEQDIREAEEAQREAEQEKSPPAGDANRD